jgi:ferredoxin
VKDGEETCEALTLTLGGKTHSLVPLAGETIVQTAFRCGVVPPISCLSGACGTCLAVLTEGRVDMLANDVLTDAEMARGYVLTCQSVPLTRAVSVVYED